MCTRVCLCVLTDCGCDAIDLFFLLDSSDLAHYEGFQDLENAFRGFRKTHPVEGFQQMKEWAKRIVSQFSRRDEGNTESESIRASVVRGCSLKQFTRKYTPPAMLAI